MRMLMKLQFPNGPFNAAVRDGTAGEKIGRILDVTKPEAAYFTEANGRRGAILVVQVQRDSEIPTLCEPWFLEFQAEVELRIAMTPQDLQDAGLESLGKEW